MTIDTSVENGTATLHPFGSIDSTTADGLQEAFDKLDITSLQGITIDFSDVDYISSKCLRILVAIHRLMEGRSICLSNLNPTVTDILNLSGLKSLFEVK